MYGISQLYNVVRVQKTIVRERISNVICIVLFLYLVLFSILSVIYLGVPSESENREPGHYDAESLTVTPVTCSFTVSGRTYISESFFPNSDQCLGP